jgi:hypothetical protein
MKNMSCKEFGKFNLSISASIIQQSTSEVVKNEYSLSLHTVYEKLTCCEVSKIVFFNNICYIFAFLGFFCKCLE